MAEQENEVLTNEEVEELAESVIPKMAARKTVYVVEQEFTHKRKHTVGSLFRPRRYPRLRPRALRELLAGGYIRPATADEQRDQANKLEVRKNVGVKTSFSSPEQPVAEQEVSTENHVKHVGGGWYEVSVNGDTRKVQGEDAANQLYEELMNG